MVECSFELSDVGMLVRHPPGESRAAAPTFAQPVGSELIGSCTPNTECDHLRIQGHSIRVMTVDLDSGWRDIRERLLGLLEVAGRR